jgi:hypothetical protein
MPRAVIAVYKPKPGKSSALDACVGRHWPLLHAERLVTERRSFVMRGAAGEIIEVFEWLSLSAIDSAHANPAVQALWSEFASCCDFVPIANVPEAAQLFSEFEAVQTGALGSTH